MAETLYPRPGRKDDIAGEPSKADADLPALWSAAARANGPALQRKLAQRLQRKEVQGKFLGFGESKPQNLAEALEAMGQEGDKYFEPVVNKLVENNLLPDDRGKKYIAAYGGLKSGAEKAEKYYEIFTKLNQGRGGGSEDEIEALKTVLSLIKPLPGTEAFFECYQQALTQIAANIKVIRANIKKDDASTGEVVHPGAWAGNEQEAMNLNTILRAAQGTLGKPIESVEEMVLWSAAKWVDEHRPVMAAAVHVPRYGTFLYDSAKQWQEWFKQNWRLVSIAMYGSANF